MIKLREEEFEEEVEEVCEESELEKLEKEFNIALLPIEKWKGYKLEFTLYRDKGYTLNLEQGDNGFSIKLEKKPKLPKTETRIRATQELGYELYTWDGFAKGGELFAYGIMDGDTLAACIEFTVDERNRCHVIFMQTEAEYRRKGYGAALLKYAMLKAEEMWCEVFYLETNLDNGAAIDFYLKEGLELLGFDQTFYIREGALIFGKRLSRHGCIFII